MQKTILCFISLILFISLPLPARANDRPAFNDCVAIHVRSSDGWWLIVKKGGSGSFGFGTGLARGAVKERTFNFTQVYAAIEEAFSNTPESATAPYMAVSYWRTGDSAAIEHYLAMNRRLLASLFRTARDGLRPAENEVESRAYDQVESFWRDSPWVGAHREPPDPPGR